MPQLTYTQDELMREHEYARPHIVGGRRMHGGFLADGRYQPPRALVREVALDAWTEQLRSRGGELFDADSSLLDGERMPSTEQSRVLLRHGLGSWFWNTLTITGKIEARGRLLATEQFPDLQPFIVDDISTMAIGHLNAGLLRAHGIDEGGEIGSGIGAHDEMWFVARDIAFGAGAYPDVEPQQNIARPEAGARFMQEVAPAVEGVLSLLMNLLVIEFRAEIGFASAQELLRTDDLFVDRRPQAQEAAEIIGRIRIDEEIHVRSLRLYLGELASVTFKTLDGSTVSGAELIQRFWSGLVRWATVEQPPLAAVQQREAITRLIETHPDAGRVRADFDDAALVVTG
ncbi:MAG TPA: hypothetical protein VFE86_18810 [Ilumatobacteraceae bacterium]|nr:hypothetical protein [Ilumatobacteraceae bacterium]